MSKYFVVILLSGISFFIKPVLHAQKIAPDGQRFEYRDFEYQILEQSKTQHKYTNFALLIKNKRIQDSSLHKIPATKDERLNFGAFANAEKKYILICGRYEFAVLNLYNQKLSSFYKPQFKGIGQDAQSGMLTSLKTGLKGRLVIGYCVDSGPFIFDFINSYEGREIAPAGYLSPENKQLFLCAHPKDKTLKTGILVECNDWDCRFSVVFHSAKIQAINPPPHCLDEESRSELSYGSPQIYYTLLLQKEAGGTPEHFVVFDLKNEKFFPLPKTVSNSDKETVYQYLKKNMD